MYQKLGLILSLGFALSPRLSLADPVDNPGDFVLAFDSGTLKLGNLDEMAIAAFSVSGTVLDGDGNVFIPAAAIILPDATVPAPIIGDVTVRFEPLADAIGTLNAVTGDATAGLSVRVHLINPLLPPGCALTPVDIALTSGSDGGLTGIPYSMDDGTATYVNNSFAVPRSSGCGFFGGIIDSQIGLPSPPPRNYVNNLHGTFDPIFTGS